MLMVVAGAGATAGGLEAVVGLGLGDVFGEGDTTGVGEGEATTAGKGEGVGEGELTAAGDGDEVVGEGDEAVGVVGTGDGEGTFWPVTMMVEVQELG